MLNFFAAAGELVWLIFAISMLMWWLILRAYLNQKQVANRMDQQTHQMRTDTVTLSQSHYRHMVNALLSQTEQQLALGLDWVSVMVKILPLLGLLGTVSGMIDSFSHLQQVDIQQQLSGGIAQAMLTTLSGLLTALSGLYFAHHLSQRKQRYLALMRSKLEVKHALSTRS